MRGAPPERPLALVFLGCGSATRLHTRTLRSLRVGVRRYYASRDPGRARAFAREHGGAGAFDSYEEALGDRAVDAAVIATPPSRHLEWSLRALAAGKQVIVEKPPFLRLADLDAARAAAGEAGRRLLVAENYFYKPLARRLRELLASDAIGEPLFLHVVALKEQSADGWRDDLSLTGRGALFEGGIHWVNLIANLGLEVRSVRGIFPGAGPPLDRSALLAVEYAGGAAGVLSYSWEVPSPLRGLRLSRIYGRRGAIAFESNGLFVAVWGRRKRLWLPGVRDIAGYRAMWRDFLDVLRSGGEPRMDLERARRDLELVEAAYGEGAAGAVRGTAG